MPKINRLFHRNPVSPGEAGFRCASRQPTLGSWVSLRFTQPTMGKLGFAALHTTYNGKVGFRCASHNLQWESWVSLRFTQPTMVHWGSWVSLRFTQPTMGKLGFAALHTNLHTCASHQPTLGSWVSLRFTQPTMVHWGSWVSLRFTQPTMGKLGFAALHTTYNGKVGFRCASHNLQWYTGEVGFRCASLQWYTGEVGFRCASHNLHIRYIFA
ncbi:hypothetical protein NIES46_38480 [Arthrospira platensis NIES-46]|uniref:Uncharacterized protein n=1 Tax=Limnospira platensis NIES-46 TaxID=1236695 RepID=A0A5M3TAU9_LIMPL|nr:hypothetical protein NIES46_38480 [Arthrospira platensis NIES-46]